MADINFSVDMDTSSFKSKTVELQRELESIDDYISGKSKGVSKNFQNFLESRGFTAKNNAIFDKKNMEVSIPMTGGTMKNLKTAYHEEQMMKLRQQYNKRELNEKSAQYSKLNRYMLQAGLSTMFFGMGVQKTFEGLLKPAEDAVGLFDVWNALLTVAFLPAAEWLLGIMIWMLEVFMGLPKPIQDLISFLGLLGLVVGTILSAAGSLMLMGVGWSAVSAVAAGTGIAGLIGGGIAGAGGAIGTEAALAGIPTMGGLGLMDTLAAGAAGLMAIGGKAAPLALLSLIPTVGADTPIEQLYSPSSSSSTYNINNNYNDATAPSGNSAYVTPNALG